MILKFIRRNGGGGYCSKSTMHTVLAQLYAPPFCIVRIVQRKRRGERLNDTLCPELNMPPPHPTHRYKAVSGY